MFIADPSRVNIQTFLEPGPGKLILTNQHSWGQGVDGALEQLQVQDVTENHIVEAGLLAQQAEDITGATDVTQGKFPGGERKSAREVGAVYGSAISRLEDLGIMADLQCLQPLGMMIGSQTQQYMSQEQHVEVIGRHADYIRRMFPNVDPSFVVVDPLSLSVDYHVEVNDGKLRAQSDPNLWKEVYGLLIQNPEAVNEISSVKVFKYMVDLMGVPNIDQFDKDDPAARVQVRADEAVLDDVERGRLTQAPGAA